MIRETYLVLIGALAWVSTKVAPGSEAMLLGMTYILIIHFLSTVLVGLKEKNLVNEIRSFKLTTIIGFYLAIAISTVLSSFFGDGETMLARAMMSGIIFYESLLVIDILRRLGVPIPDALVAFLGKFNNKADDKDIDSLKENDKKNNKQDKDIYDLENESNKGGNK